MSSPEQSQQEKVIFRGELHASSISQKLQIFYENNEFLDTIVITGSDSVHIKAHGIVLSALSEYFLDVFRNIQSTSNTNIIKLEEIEASALKSAIDFMYVGWIELSLENVESLLRTASYLRMQVLIDGCIEFIADHTTHSNCLRWLRFSTELSLLELKKRILTFTYNHFEEVSKGKELPHINQIELKELLFDENPDGDCSEHVFLSLVAWIDYDQANRKHLSFEFLSLIHYKYLTPKLIIENTRSICNNVECYQLVCTWLQWHLSPETRLNEQTNCKLAVISHINTVELIIQTYHEELDSWSVERFRTYFPRKTICSRIVIDGKLLIVGGFKEPESVDCLFLNTLKSIRLPSMQNKRIKSQLANLGGQLCVFGGMGDNMDSIELYNCQKREWIYVEPLHKPSKCSKIVAHNGVLYIIDFKNCILQSYHQSSNQWSSRRLPEEKLSGFGCAAVGRFLYVIGGYNYGKKEYVKTVKRYTISNDTWCEVTPLPLAGVFKTTVFKNNIVCCRFDPYCHLVAVYNPDTDAWRTLSQLPLEPRHFSIILALPVSV